jgi:hypothetical protein
MDDKLLASPKDMHDNHSSSIHPTGKITMKGTGAKNLAPSPLYRCAGPNCGITKSANNRWWLMWTSAEQFNTSVLYLAPWNEELARSEGALYVCGESCAQKLQSQFMGNILANQPKAPAKKTRG